MYLKYIIKLTLIIMLLGCGEKHLTEEMSGDIITFDSYNNKTVESIAKYGKYNKPGIHEYIIIMFTDKTSIVLEAGKYQIIVK